MFQMKAFPNEKIVNEDVNYAGLKTVKKKNYYGVAHDEKTKKSFLVNIENATKIQAKKFAQSWARKNKLVFEGVYSN